MPQLLIFFHENYHVSLSNLVKIGMIVTAFIAHSQYPYCCKYCFSEREREFTMSSSVRPLSVVCMSVVCNVRASYSAG